MKNKRICRPLLHAFNFEPTTVAHFGAARLVRHFAGTYEVVGGTHDDQAAAREWCSLFAPEVVFSDTPRRNPVSAFVM
jgi:hypothetical protein